MQIIQCHKFVFRISRFAFRKTILLKKGFYELRATSDKRRLSAFTLIELVLAIAIIGLSAMLLGPPLVNAVKGFTMMANRKSALSGARLAMERMFSETILIPSTDDIDTWTGTNFQFDIPTESNISYALNSGNLERSGVILTDDVTSLTFAYYDSSGNTASTKADIKRVGFEIVVNAGTGSGTLKTRTQAFPRRFSSAYDGFE